MAKTRAGKKKRVVKKKGRKRPVAKEKRPVLRVEGNGDGRPRFIEGAGRGWWRISVEGGGGGRKRKMD